MRKFIPGFVVLTIVFAMPSLYAQSASSSDDNSWTGFYIGVNAGRAWKKETTALTVVNDSPNNYFNPAAIPGVNGNGSTSLDVNGFTGGGQLGYNQQDGNLVWGLEGEFSYLGLKQSHGGTFTYTTSPATYQLVTSESNPWLVTVRPRVGFSADRWYFFGTGGLAATHSRFQQDFSEGVFTPAPMQILSAQTKFGWTAGAGMEVALGRRMSAKGEYLFNHFRDASATGRLNGANGDSVAPGFVDGATFNNTIGSLKFNVVRFGLNFRF